VRNAVVLILALSFSPLTNSEELKDPTRPPSIIVPGKHSEEHKVAPHVTAIFLSGMRRVAIFNAQPVHAGDSVGDYRIDEVAAEGVRYSVSGHSAFAPLRGSTAAMSSGH
jgi:hypothetical protein